MSDSKHVLPITLFANEKTGTPLKILHLRFTNRTTLKSIVAHAKRCLKTCFEEREGPSHTLEAAERKRRVEQAPDWTTSRMWILWHERTKAIMQRDVDNCAFEAYSYVPGMVLDMELAEDVPLVQLVGCNSDGSVKRGTLVAFSAQWSWHPLNGCIRPPKRQWGSKFTILQEFMHADPAEIVMEYLSCGKCSVMVRDSEVEAKLSARELKDKNMKRTLEALIAVPDDHNEVIGQIRNFFASDYRTQQPLQTSNSDQNLSP